MTDVLYIHPLGLKSRLGTNDENGEKTFFPIIPMGVIGILNNLKEGCTVSGINLSMKKILYGDHFSLEHYLKNTDFKVVLIDMHWYLHIKGGLRVAQLCKKIKPDCVVIVGGMSASIFARQLIKYPFIDFVIKGDGEDSCKLLVNSILGKEDYTKTPNIAYKNGENAIRPISDVNKYDYVNMDFMEDQEQYQKMFDYWLLIAKGCRFKCRYCDGNYKTYPRIYNRNGLIVRDAEKVSDDVRRMEGKTEMIGFSHDIAMLGKGFCDKLLNEKFRIGIRNEFFQIPSFELIERMSKSFDALDLVFSPVAGSYFERKKYGKDFTNRKFFNLLRRIRKLDFDGGVTVYFTDYMIAPGIRKKLNARSREKMIRKIKKIYPGAIIEVQNQIIDPMCLIKKGYSEEDLFKVFAN